MKLLVGLSKGKRTHEHPQDVISCCSNPSVSAARVLSASRLILCFFVCPFQHTYWFQNGSIRWNMNIFCRRVSKFFPLLWRTLVLLQRISSCNQQQAFPKCFCISGRAVKALSERLHPREDSNRNNLLSKLLFANRLWTSTAKCWLSSRWISSPGLHLWQFKERGVTDNRRTTATSHSLVTHNPSEPCRGKHSGWQNDLHFVSLTN